MRRWHSLTVLKGTILVLSVGVSRAAYLEGLLCEDPMPWPGRLLRCAVGPATAGAWAAPTVGDVTGDGVADLVVGSAYGDVLLYEGRPDGVFGPPRLLLVGDVPEAMPTLQPAVPCLLRGSGDLLVLRAGRLLRYRRTALGLAAGTEVTGSDGAPLAEQLVKAGGASPTGLAASGGEDLFVADARGRVWHAALLKSERCSDLRPLTYGGGQRLSFPPPVSLAVADVDNNAEEELVIGSATSIHACDFLGAEVSAPQKLAQDIRTREGLVAERLAPAAERPGVLVIGTRWGTLLRCRLEKRLVTAVEPVQAQEVPLDCGLCAAPSAVDWDGDGRLDLVVAGADGLIRVFLTLRGGLFDGPTTLADNTGPIRLPVIDGYAAGCPAFADLDCDGRVDLLVGCMDGRVLVYRNEGRFVPKGPLHVGGQELVCAGVPAVEPIDWDADGDIDLLVGTQPRPASDSAEVQAESLSPIQFLENQATRGAWCRYHKAVPVDMAARWQGVQGEGAYIGTWQLRLSPRLQRDRSALVLGPLGVYVFGLATVPPAYPRLVAETEGGVLRPWRARGAAWSMCQFGDELAVGLGPYGFVSLAQMPHH